MGFCFKSDHLVERAVRVCQHIVRDLEIAPDARVVGVAGIEHTVITTDSDKPRAELVVSFVVLPTGPVEVRANNGYRVEELAARDDLPCRVVVAKGVEPLSILGDERDPPPHLASVKMMC